MLSEVISVGSTVKVLVDYRPVRDDELGVTKVIKLLIWAHIMQWCAYKITCSCILNTFISGIYFQGQMVTVLEIDSIRGAYRITNKGTHRKDSITSGPEEGWVPSYVLNLLTSTPRRGPAWTFRKFRKPSFTGSIGRKDSSGNNSVNNSPTSPYKPLTSLKGIEH